MATLAMRFFGVLAATKEDLPLAFKVTEAIVKDKAGLAEVVRQIPTCRIFLGRGLVVAHSSVRPALLTRIAKDGANKYRSCLIKVGAVQDSEDLDASAFAKIVEIKSEADIAGVAAKLQEEVFGKNAPALSPIDRSKIVFTEAAGDVTADEVKAAMGAFGKVEGVSQTQRNCHRIIFDSKESVAAALAKKEVACGSTKLQVSDKAPRREPKQAAKGAKAPAANGRARDEAPRFYMKVENFPESLDAKALKELYSKFGADVADINRDKKHCILRFRTAESVAQVVKEKIVAPGGVELVAKPYSPKSGPRSGGNAAAGGANGSSSRSRRDRDSRPVTYPCYIDGADPSKCSAEQLEAIFKGFKGFVKLSYAKDDKYTARYDNPESVAEVLKSKEITCNGVKLKVANALPPRPEGEASAPRAGRKAVIAKPAEGVTEEQIKTALQALDKDVSTVVGKRSGDILITFSSPEAKQASVGKEIKVGGQTLKIGA